MTMPFLTHLQNCIKKHFILFWIFTFYLAISAFRHYSLNSGIYDLGLFTQWSYLSGLGRIWEPSSLSGFVKPALGDHFSLHLLPLGILFRIWPSPYLLIVIQSIGLAAYSFLFIKELIHLMPEQKFRWPVIFAVVLNPFTINAALNDFHPETAAMPLALLALLYLRKKKYLLSLVFLVLFITSKEAMAIFGVGYSLYALHKQKYLIALASLLFSLAYFFHASSVVDLYQSYSIGRYGYLGQDFLSVLKTILLNPWVPVLTIFSWSSVTYILGLWFPLSPFLTSRYALPGLFASAPLLSANLLSTAESMRSPIYQYQLPVLVFFLIASLDSLEKRDSSYRSTSILSIPYLYLASSLISFWFLTQWTLFPTKYLQSLSLASDVRRTSQGLASPALRIWADERIATHFAARRFILYKESDLELYDYDYLVIPRPASPGVPKKLFVKARNFLLGYGDSPLFDGNESIVNRAESLGYECNSERIAVCSR